MSFVSPPIEMQFFYWTRMYHVFATFSLGRKKKLTALELTLATTAWTLDLHVIRTCGSKPQYKRNDINRSCGQKLSFYSIYSGVNSWNIYLKNIFVQAKISFVSKKNIYQYNFQKLQVSHRAENFNIEGLGKTKQTVHVRAWERVGMPAGVRVPAQYHSVTSRNFAPNR